jgi:4-amino-4-deoxy-L-arabinose transferase-like glycosyltransferase
MHSDEAWLSGLTRNMMRSGSLQVTEPFFDLKPRYPHAIKMLFHLLQMPFIAVFGYTLFAVRLLSLICGGLALLLFYRCARATAGFPVSLGLTAAVSVNGQFLLAAHTARQEILLLFMLLSLAAVLLQSKGEFKPRTAVTLGVLAGLSAGLHPNALLPALGCGCAMLCHMLAAKRFRWKPLLAYVGVTGGLAAVFVAISLAFDAQFVPHWLRYGDTEFELLVPFANKFSDFPAYLARLWNGSGGTYALPDLKPQLMLCALLPAIGIVQAVRTKKPALLTGIGLWAGALLGTVLIGRYNQLSAVLWMFPALLMAAALLKDGRRAAIGIAALAVAFALPAMAAVRDAYRYDYEAYVQQISTAAAADTKTLANLNAGFAFDNGKLLDVRNLTYLQENNLTFAQYVESRGIETIVWSDEMRFLYDRRPDFNTLYGNLRYVPEVEAFLATRCTLLESFEAPGFGMRLKQAADEPCLIRVYRVNP